MKNLAFRCCLASFLILTSRAMAAAPDFSGSSPLQWSIRMADAQMTRSGESIAKGKWDYANNVFLLSLLNLGERTSDPKYAAYAQGSIGPFISSDGQIRGYRADDYNLDNINPGKTLLRIWQSGKEERFKSAAVLLRKQLETHPRTSEGGFWHKKIYPHQMWLDGLYMQGPFVGEYGKLFNQPADFDEVAKQIRLVADHTYDAKTGLFYHGWDESREQSWANKTTGTSPSFWSRAIGWYAMALVDTLDYIPTDHPKRAEIIATLNKLIAGVVKYQDAESGLWYQVTDQGSRAGNYLEASGSSMFVYAIAKAINKEYIPRDPYQSVAIKGFTGLTGKLIKLDANGAPSLTQCCSVAGLGNGRDGTFEYYLREPIVENDMKAVGPFIMAGIEMQRLLGLPLMLQAAPANDWMQADQILARIKAPTFPDRKFDITTYGAVAGETNDASAAITKAIDACNAAGGGHVIVPAGVFVTGPIVLKSNVDLHLNEGATLAFKTDPNAYLPVVLTRYEGMDLYNYSPLIRAYEQENIAITGSGTLDGQADERHWWNWIGMARYGSRDGEPNQRAARSKLAQNVTDNVPVEQRRFGEGSFLRPNFVQPYKCRNVLIEGVNVRRSPMWELHPILCTNVIVRGVNIMTHGPNNDGCDPESCKDVLIENCLFDTGDDCIAIKSGRNNDGRRVNVASENIIIRNCTMKDGHGGVTIGSEISGSCRNVFVENCNMDSVNLDRVLRLKSNAVRGGVIENVFMRNITVGRVADAVLQIDFMYEEGSNGPYKPAARNINMENISVKQTPRVLNVVGFAGADISGVQIRNSNFLQVANPDVVKEAQDVKLVDCKIEKKS